MFSTFVNNPNPISMKKIFLLVVVSFCNICAFAQHPSFFEAVKSKKTGHELTRLVPVNNQVQSPPFFSEDFSAGIPAGWSNVDNSGNGVLWRTTTTGAFNTTTPVEEQLNPAGTSASNGYLILDSDSAGAVNENTDLTTVAINCSGHAAVHMVFNEYFAQYGASTGAVKVSNDNINWVDVHHAESGLTSDSGTANPYSLDIDISATAANQSTVYIRFNYTGANDYWWFVDDLELYEPSAIDLAASSIQKLNSEYTKIPLVQATALDLSGEITNVGFNASGVGSALMELVDVGNAVTVFSENVSLSALSPGSSQTVVPSASFAPTASGTYNSRITVALAGDVNSVNDVIESDPVFISDSTYQRDDDVYAGVQGIGFGPGENGTAGQGFLVNTESDITSITFFLKDTFSFGASGTPLFFTIHPQLNSTTAPDGATVLAISDTLLLFDGMIPSGGAFYTLHLQGGSLHVTPGLYFIGFHEVDGLIPMGYSNNIFTPNAVWAYASSMGWFKPEDFGFYLTYVIRPNFGMIPDGIANVSNAQQMVIYPNPSDGVFTIGFDKSHAFKVVMVHNLLGELVYTNKINGLSKELIDVSNLSNGVYSVSLSGNGNSVYKMISVAHN